MAYNVAQDADKIVSGQFADARVAESSITQHEAALEPLLELNKLGVSGLVQLGDFLISSDVDPTQAGHFSRKGYVDAQVSAASTSASDAVTAEETRALAAEAGLQGQINDILSNTDPAALDSLTEIVAAFQGADSDLSQSITDVLGQHTSELAAETARAQAAEVANANAISAEASRAQTAEQANAAGVAANAANIQGNTDQISANQAQAVQDLVDEANARIAADGALQTAIDSEAATARAAEVANANAISAEASRAQAAEAQIAADLTDEVTARGAAVTAAIADYDSKIQAENARALAAESALGSRIDDVLSNADASALDSLSEVVAAFQSADSDLNDAMTTLLGQHSAALNSVVAQQTAINTAFGTDIAANAQAVADEIVRAQAAESSLSSDISDEATQRAAAVQAVQDDLDEFKAGHQIGSDVQAHSEHLQGVSGGDYSQAGMAVKFENVGPGAALAMGDASYYVLAGAGATITLPAGATAGRRVEIKCTTGIPAQPVTVQGGTVDGAASLSMAFDFMSVSLTCDGSGNWYIG